MQIHYQTFDKQSNARVFGWSITFTEDGRVLVSRSLKDAQMLGVEKSMKLVGVATRQAYLDHHRRKVFVA